MKHTKQLTLAAIAVPALLAFAIPGDSVSFAPEESTTITKTFRMSGSFSLDDMSMLMNGMDPGMMPAMEMDMTIEQTVRVTDVYEAMRAAMPEKLTRTFEEIGTEMEFEISIDMMGETNDQSADGSGSSELEGLTVVFVWDEDAEEYDKSFEDGEGDEDLLEGLLEDMDLRVLLPEDDVAEGDTWEIELSRLPDLFAPGGDFSLDIEMDGETMPGGPDPAMMSNFREMLGDLLEGDATATYKGSRDEDGVRVGVIDFEIDIDTARDMSDLLSEMMDQMPEGVEMELQQVDIEFTFAGSGTLLWNLAAGHLHSFQMDGEAAITIDMGMTMDMAGEEMTMEMSMSMSGTLSQSVEVE